MKDVLYISSFCLIESKTCLYKTLLPILIQISTTDSTENNIQVRRNDVMRYFRICQRLFRINADNDGTYMPI